MKEGCPKFNPSPGRGLKPGNSWLAVRDLTNCTNLAHICALQSCFKGSTFQLSLMHLMRESWKVLSWNRVVRAGGGGRGLGAYIVKSYWKKGVLCPPPPHTPTHLESLVSPLLSTLPPLPPTPPPTLKYFALQSLAVVHECDQISVVLSY